MTKVFLSYSRADESQAERLYRSLCEHGLDIWFDKESLLPGQNWEEEIKREIHKSDFVILLLSIKSVGRRGFFQKELRLALDVLDTIPLGHVYLLPIRLDTCEIPSRLAAIHYVDLFPHWDRGLAKVFKSIELQSGIRSRAEVAETQKGRSEAIRILLVNDQPATMNFAADLWKSCGATVDFAFDVPQAINCIERSSYRVVVSDLSHFSPWLVTDRAAFEILEWAQASGKDVKVIISTGDVTTERRKLAKELGAVGICNNLQDLNDLLATTTGLPIDYPSEFAALKTGRNSTPDNRDVTSSDETPGEEVIRRHRVYFAWSREDRPIAERLANDLRKYGIDTWLGISSLGMNMTWDSPIKRAIQDSDAMLAIVSGHSVNSSWFQYEVSAGVVRETNAEGMFVLPLVLDDEAVTNMPYLIRRRQYVDFRNDYEKALADLVLGLNAILESKRR
jgi:CheY-like chemotaxis protein